MASPVDRYTGAAHGIDPAGATADPDRREPAGAVRANPIVPGFHPDPTICRVGGDYYLACSSFEYFPGVPLFHSRNLFEWRQIGNALDRPTQLRLATAPASGGVYAPTLRHHGGRFWLATTNASDRGHLIVTADDPAGPWSEPVHVDGLPGIDPDLAWDDAGTCWFTYSVYSPDGRTGGIMQAPIDPEAGAVLREPRRLWSGTGLTAPEAPHLYRIDGWWYLVIAEGGTERGHAVSVARGERPDGPFLGHPDNPVLSHRSTNLPVQNTGHGDLVQAADGSWWMALLGVRPRGGTPGFHVLGRETFLTRVYWRDGWPIPQPVELVEPATPVARERDEFDGPALAHHWIAVGQPPASISSLGRRPGWLTIASGDGRRPSGADSASARASEAAGTSLVARRQQHTNCRVRARVDPGSGRGGLTIRIDEAHHYDIEAGSGGVACLARIGPVAAQVADHRTDAGPLVLVLDVVSPGHGADSLGAPPDRIRFGVERGVETTWLCQLDGRYLSTEVAGGFTGRVIGMYAGSGTVAFDWFEYAGG